MGNVKLYKGSSLDGKGRTPIQNGLAFSNLIKGKKIDEMGWFGEGTNISEAHIRFIDDSYLVVGWSHEYECPAMTYVVSPKK